MRHPADDLFSLIPPDLLLEDWLRAAWQSPGSPDAISARQGLALRLGFDAVLEAGLRSRLGRTLETTGTAVAEVIVSEDEWEQVVGFATEAVQANCRPADHRARHRADLGGGRARTSTSPWGHLPPLPRSLRGREWEALGDLGWG